MMRVLTYIVFLSFGLSSLVSGMHMDADTSKIDSAVKTPVIRGYHIGVVQPLMKIQNNEAIYLTRNSFYTIGFPMGITFGAGKRLLFDMEFVPFVTPFLGTNDPIKVHLLYHPGLLIPLGEGFTAGIRLAYEVGIDQIGATLLLNKSWKLSGNSSFFTEFVLPGRVGPDKSSGYTQIVALHLGIGFN